MGVVRRVVRGVVRGGSPQGSPRSSPWGSPRSGGQWVVRGAGVSLFNSPILYLLDFRYFLLTAEEGYFVVPLFSHLIPCAYIFSLALFVKRRIREGFSMLFLM